MIEPFQRTCLSLAEYARVMGINPAHFWGGVGSSVMAVGASCSSIWWQHSWQAVDRVSREDLAMSIYDAENEIARLLGWWPAPVWELSEEHPWPTHYDRTTIGGMVWGLRAKNVSVRTSWGKVIAPGRRVETFIDNPRVTYTDADGDGFFETATVTCATTLTDTNEIKVFHTGYSGDQEWEIRPARSKTIAGGVFTGVFYAWQFVDPDLYETFPTTSSVPALDFSVTTSYVLTVDVYRVRNDESQTGAQLVWEPDSLACSQTLALETQNGTFIVHDHEIGDVVPYAATYGTAWVEDDWTCDCNAPDRVRLWYYHGAVEPRYTAGKTDDPLMDYFAHAIAWMATARLERPMCACGSLVALAEHLRQDLALQGETSFASTEEILNCPFGTRRGEVMAWKRCAKFSGAHVLGVAI